MFIHIKSLFYMYISVTLIFPCSMASGYFSYTGYLKTLFILAPSF